MTGLFTSSKRTSYQQICVNRQNLFTQQLTTPTIERMFNLSFGSLLYNDSCTNFVRKFSGFKILCND